MKRSLLIIFIIVGSLLLISCTTENPTEDTDPGTAIEEDAGNGNEEVEYDIEEEPIEEITANGEIKELDLEIDFLDGSEWDFKYDLDDNEFEIEGRENLQGEEARARIEELIEAMDISMDRSIREIKDNLFNHLDINEEDVEDFDLDIEYMDNREIEIKVHF